MAGDSAFPKLDTAGTVASRPALPSAEERISDSRSQRDLTRLFPFADARRILPGRHTGGRGLRRRLAAFGRVPSQIRILLAEEAAHGHGFLFVPVIIGSGAAYWFSLRQDPAFWPFLIAFVAFSALAAIARHRAGMARLIPLSLAFLTGGMLLAELETARRATVMIDTPVTTEVTGRIERREYDAKGRWRYVLHVEATANPTLRRPPERATLLAIGRHRAFEPGETITGRARLSPPSGPALPGLNDFAFSSYFDGIGAVGFFYGAPRKADGAGVPGEGREAWGARIERWLFDLRGRISAHIRATVPGDAGAFAAAIVTDERRAISQETTEALRLAGLAHIIAISGLNMALAAGIFFVGARTVLSLFIGFSQAHAIKKIAAFGALLMVTAYYLISGFGVSAERAYIMMAVLLIAVLFDRPSISLRNVALSALIILALSPSEILGPSFQMSFAATVALVAGYALWQRRPRRREPDLPFLRHPAFRAGGIVWNFAAGIFVTSLIGGLSSAIYSVEHFHRIATYGLAANLAAMPIISFVVMPAGLFGMLLMPFGLEAPFLQVMGLGLDAVIAIAKYVAGWGGDVAVGRQHAGFLGLATLGFLLLMLLRTRLRLVGLPFLALAFCLSPLEGRAPLPDLLVSEDGTMVALLDGETVVTNRMRPPSFIYDQWKRALLIGEAEPPPLMLAARTVSRKPTNSASTNQPKNQTPTNRTSAGRVETERHLAADVSDAIEPQTASEAQQNRKPASARNPRLTPQDIAAARKGMEGAASGRFTCAPKAWCASVSKDGVMVVAVEDGRYAGIACDAAHIVIAPRARFDTCRSDALLINGPMLRKAGSLEISLNGSPEPGRWRIRAALAQKAQPLDRPWARHRQYDWRRQQFDRDFPEPFRTILIGTDRPGDKGIGTGSLDSGGPGQENPGEADLADGAYLSDSGG